MAAFLLMGSIFHLKSSFWVEYWKQHVWECWNIPGFQSTFTDSICDGNDSSCETDGNFKERKNSVGVSYLQAREGSVLGVVTTFHQNEPVLALKVRVAAHSPPGRAEVCAPLWRRSRPRRTRWHPHSSGWGYWGCFYCCWHFKVSLVLSFLTHEFHFKLFVFKYIFVLGGWFSAELEDVGVVFTSGETHFILKTFCSGATRDSKCPVETSSLLFFVITFAW